MIEVNSFLYMTLWELVLGLIAIGVVVIVRTIVRRRRERASIDALVSAVKNDTERRKKELRNLLEKKYDYNGEQLDKTVKKISKEERRVYKTLVSLITNRDSMTIENLNITFEEAVEPYRRLEVQKAPEIEATDADGADQSEELKRLNTENRCLSEELRITMNTLSRLLNEYSTTFGGAGNTGPGTEELPGTLPENFEKEAAGEAANETPEIVLEQASTDLPGETQDTPPEAVLEEPAEEAATSSIGGFLEDDSDGPPEEETKAAPEAISEKASEQNSEAAPDAVLEEAPEEAPEEESTIEKAGGLLEDVTDDILDEDIEAALDAIIEETPGNISPEALERE